jgi:hypothetical protein
MNLKTINLAFRFLLEVISLIVYGSWGFNLDQSWVRFVGMIGVPAAAAVLWGIFAVPDDPSRSGKAPIPVPGWLRLILELIFFAGAVWMLKSLGRTPSAWLFGTAVLLHYSISWERIQWLLRS